MHMHASSELVVMNVCVMHPPPFPDFDNMFVVFCLLYQSRLERFVL